MPERSGRFRRILGLAGKAGERRKTGSAMNERKSAILTIVFLSSVILIFTAADLIQGDRLFSETENKLLASRPKFTWEALFQGKYTEDYEKYLTDQFVGREKWITIKTCTDITLGRQEINGVYLGKDNYLIERHLPETYSLVQEIKKISLLENLVQTWDADVMLVPTADNILTDKLPVNAPCYDQVSFLERVEQQVGAEHYVDVYTILRQHAEEEIYYRTDHHWTTLGAFYGYQAWAQARGGSEGKYDSAAMETITEEFLGTLHSKVNLNLRPDAIRYFPETVSRPLKVTYDLKTVRESCYEESYLETKNKYGFFLDDNHGIVEIETDYHNGKTLFVIKDSYANCFIPLLIPDYEKIYVMDLRYFNGRLFQFMKSCEPEEGMDVLVLYNCIHFLDNFTYLE